MKADLETDVLVAVNKIPPALKHAAYSATTLLPGEDAAAFDKLHQALIAEFAPVGALEEDIVSEIARLTWRKQNLATFRTAELAQERFEEICREKVPFGDIYQLIDIGEPATVEGLMKELEIKERLDGLISKCLKQLLMVRGVKSLSVASSSVPTPQISAPRKAG